MGKITVYLIEGYGNLDEGFAFTVDSSELWEDYYGDVKNLVAVKDRYDKEYYIYEEVVEEISERVA